jgi:hypothetical protein
LLIKVHRIRQRSYERSIGRRICAINVVELVMESRAIGDYIDHHNEHPKPFISTARASDILKGAT